VQVQGFKPGAFKLWVYETVFILYRSPPSLRCTNASAAAFESSTSLSRSASARRPAAVPASHAPSTAADMQWYKLLNLEGTFENRISLYRCKG
jgi:hypothetical protein